MAKVKPNKKHKKHLRRKDPSRKDPSQRSAHGQLPQNSASPSPMPSFRPSRQAAPFQLRPLGQAPPSGKPIIQTLVAPPPSFESNAQHPSPTMKLRTRPYKTRKSKPKYAFEDSWSADQLYESMVDFLDVDLQKFLVLRELTTEAHSKVKDFFEDFHGFLKLHVRLMELDPRRGIQVLPKMISRVHCVCGGMLPDYEDGEDDKADEAIELVKALEKQVRSLVYYLRNHYIDLVRKHRPPIEDIVTPMLEISAHDYMHVYLLYEMRDVLGDDGLLMFERGLEKIIEQYEEVRRNHTFLVCPPFEERLFRFKKSNDLMYAIKGDIKKYLEVRIGEKGEEISSHHLTILAVALELITLPLIHAAISCMESIPLPAPTEELLTWYRFYSTLLKHTGEDEKAREVRWKFTSEVQNWSAVQFYLNDLQQEQEQGSDYLASQQYTEDIARVKHALVHQFDLHQAAQICMESQDIFGDVFEELMLHRCSESCPINPSHDIWDEFLKSSHWQQRSPVGVLILARAALRNYFRQSQITELQGKHNEVKSLAHKCQQLALKVPQDRDMSQKLPPHSEFIASITAGDVQKKALLEQET